MPELLVPPGVDPHDFTLRPSQIRALQTADIIVLMGNGLEPWWDGVADKIGAGRREAGPDGVDDHRGDFDSRSALACTARPGLC